MIFPVHVRGYENFKWHRHLQALCVTYEGCSESICPLWISVEPVAWPLCNLATSQRRPYCASVNSHSPVGLVSRQWDAVDWACVLCDCRIHNNRTSRLASSQQCACPFYSSCAGLFAKHHITQVCKPPYTLDLAPCDLWLFPKLKSPLKGRRFVNLTVTQYTSSVNGVSLPTD
jgi:hypothetical protein